MLDMGFIHQLKKIMRQVPDKRQSLLFSATMPKPIEKLTQEYLVDPVHISVAPESTTAERVNQGVLHVANGNKLKILQAILNAPSVDRALVFSRTKHSADKIVRKLLATGVNAMAIHGNQVSTSAQESTGRVQGWQVPRSCRYGYRRTRNRHRWHNPRYKRRNAERR